MKRKSCSNLMASIPVNSILYEFITNYYIIWWSWFAWIVYFRQVCWFRNGEVGHGCVCV